MKVSRRLIRQLSFLGTFHRYGISLACGIAVAAIAWSESPGAVDALAGWDGFALAMIVLAWARIVSASPAVVVRVADIEHTSRLILLGIVLGGACSSLGAVAFVL